jgi:hypothetical protein
MTRAARAFDETLLRLGIEEKALDAESFGRRAALLAASELLWEREIGPVLKAKDLEELLGCSRQAISDRVKRHRLLALPHNDGQAFPAFQFASDGQPVAGLPEILQVLLPLTETPYSVAGWLAAPEDELEGERPIDVLRRGEVEAASMVARHFAERLRR